MDFSKLVEVFDGHAVTFVCITQSFNTTTSMGRLTLNILLSFAQFEREVIGERIRDKFAASRARGMWMGGHPPLGYEVRDRKLVVNETEAAMVRMIFERFLRVGSATVLVRELAAEGVTTKRGKPVDKGFLYKLLNNRVYVGEAVHKGVAYPGEHQAIIGRDLWDKVHSIIQQSPRSRAANTRAQTPAMLKGIIFGADGRAMTPTHARKGGRLYRYYVAAGLLKGDVPPGVVRRLPAAEIEAAVVDQLRGLLRAPEIIIATWRAARSQDDGARRGRGARGAAEPRSDVGRVVPRRAGARSPASHRARRGSPGPAGPAAARRWPADPGRRSARRQDRAEGGLMTDARLSPDGRTLTVRVPMTFAKRGGRKVVISPDGGDAWAPATRGGSRTHDQGAGAGASVEEDDGGGDISLGWGTGRSRGCQPLLRQPGAAADAAGAGHRRGDSGGTAAEGQPLGRPDEGHAV